MRAEAVGLRGVTLTGIVEGTETAIERELTN